MGVEYKRVAEGAFFFGIAVRKDLLDEVARRVERERAALEQTAADELSWRLRRHMRDEAKMGR